MTLYEQSKQGADAAQVLENQAYKDAMERLKREVVTAWKECPVRDKEGQLMLLQLAKLADKFEAVLAGMIQGGKLADHQIELDKIRNEGALKRKLRQVF